MMRKQPGLVHITTTIHYEVVLTNAFQICFHDFIQAGNSLTDVSGHISMQDKCCKMIRVTACLFGCLVSLITPTLSVSSATTPWLKQQTCFLFSVHSKVAEQVWQIWQPVDHAMF